MTEHSPNEFSEIYRLIVEQSSDAVIFADADGRVRIWNSSAESIFGFSTNEIIGKSLNLIIPDDLRAAHWRASATAIKAGHTQHQQGALTTRSITKGREKIYVNLSFSIICNRAGVVLGALAFGRDVTPQYSSEKGSKKRIAELEQALKRLYLLN